MNKVRALFFVLAIVVAGATVFAVMALMDRRGAKDAAPGMAMEIVDVLVARRPLPAGTVITGEHVAFQTWPKANVKPGYIVRDRRSAKRQDFNGYVVTRGFYPGEPILAGALFKPGRQTRARCGRCPRPTGPSYLIALSRFRAA